MVVKKVLILHGWGGSDAPHWQSWLATELVQSGHIVSFAKLSDKDTPSKDVWIRETLEILDEFHPDVVICHSLANILWFHLCEILEFNVKKLLLVAVPRDLSDITELESFFPVNTPTNLYADYALMVASDNDKYMSLNESMQLAFDLGIELKVLKNGGHINADSGFGKWEWVLGWSIS